MTCGRRRVVETGVETESALDVGVRLKHPQEAMQEGPAGTFRQHRGLPGKDPPRNTKNRGTLAGCFPTAPQRRASSQSCGARNCGHLFGRQSHAHD